MCTEVETKCGCANVTRGCNESLTFKASCVDESISVVFASKNDIWIVNLVTDSNGDFTIGNGTLPDGLFNPFETIRMSISLISNRCTATAIEICGEWYSCVEIETKNITTINPI